jgi:hypothetical protein
MWSLKIKTVVIVISDFFSKKTIGNFKKKSQKLVREKID